MKKVTKPEAERYDWLLTESGTDTDGAIVRILPDRTVKEIKKHIQDKIRYVKKNDSCYDYGTERLKEIVERKYDGKLYSVYGYAVGSDWHTDFEAHVLDLIDIEYRKEKAA